MLAHLQEPFAEDDTLGSSAREAVDELHRIVYSPAEAAQVLGCSRQTIYELIRRGEIHAFKVGSLTKLRVSQVHALVGESA